MTEVAREAAEAFSEGLNCLYAFGHSDSALDRAALSQMRNALLAIRSDARIRTTWVIEDFMISDLDAILANESEDAARIAAHAYVTRFLGDRT